MNKRLITYIFLTVLLTSPLARSSFASPLTIDDSRLGANTYWGGTVIKDGVPDEPDAWGDVIAPTLVEYSVDMMSIDQSADKLTTTVTLTGNYFSYLSQNAVAYAPGDLYISTSGWQVSSNDGPHYATDKFNLSEGWDYAVSFLTGDVYLLNSDPTMTSGGRFYRADQAWRGGYDSAKSIADGTVSLTATSLTFTFPSIGGSSLDPFSMGYHWTMQCGNDVVEGTPVPEPSTLFLMGSGLLGIVILGKRRLCGKQ
jgi:hypothetical protein